jgi:hypothetical protein
MIEGPPRDTYGKTRARAASVSYAQIEAAAEELMAGGGYPSVAAVRKALKRGSTTTIAEAMRRFWKDQAALRTGNPSALTRLPPAFADAATALWEQALKLSQQTARSDDNAARERLKQIEADQEIRAHAFTLREKEWEAAARQRDRALTDAREHLLLLSKSLGRDQATIKAHEARIADLEAQIALYRQQIAALLAGAIVQKTSRPRAAARTAAPLTSRKPFPSASSRQTPVTAKQKVGAKTKSPSPGRSPSKKSARRMR